jgi:hypothetical protein
VYGARQYVQFYHLARVSFSIDQPMQPIAELPQELALIESEQFNLNFLVVWASDVDGSNRHEKAVARCAA